MEWVKTQGPENLVEALTEMNNNTRLQDVNHLIHISFVHSVYPVKELVFRVFYVAKEFLPSKKAKEDTRKTGNLHCIKYAGIRENTDQWKPVFSLILFSARVRRKTLQLSLPIFWIIFSNKI